MIELERINARLLINEIEKSIKLYMENIIFEVNDETTVERIRSNIETYLESVKVRRALNNYKVEATGPVVRELNWIERVFSKEDTITDYSSFGFNITLNPMKSLEFINLKINL